MNGTLEIDSEPDSGTTVIVSLPLGTEKGENEAV